MPRVLPHLSGTHKRAKQPSLRRTIEEVLRVPLNPQGKRGVFAFYSLDHPALVTRSDAQTLAELVHCLGMERVRMQALSAGDPRKVGSGVGADPLSGKDRLEVWRGHERLVSATEEGSAERHIEHLRTAADAEDRDVLLKRF